MKMAKQYYNTTAVRDGDTAPELMMMSNLT